MNKKHKIIGMDMASGPSKTVIIIHPSMVRWDPDYVAELEAMESVELIITDTVLDRQNHAQSESK